MKNLCITLHLKTPLIPGKYPLNLDGLLYWAAYEGHKESDDAALEVLAKALDSENGVFKSSDLIYLQTPEGSIHQTTAVFPTTMQWREYKHPMAKRSIMELGGPYRSRLTSYSAISAQAVRFYAVGDADLIYYLLDSVLCIGRGNNQGHGEISEIVIEEIKQDLSWYRLDKRSGEVELQRCLPVVIAEKVDALASTIADLPVTTIRSKPPYTSGPDHIGYSTTFKREVLRFL